MLVVALEKVFDHIGIVERHRVTQVLRDLGNAVAKRLQLRITLLVPLLEFRVPHDLGKYSVIPPLQRDVAIFSGVGPRYPQRGHHGLGAGIGKAYEFGCGHHLADAFGNLVFELGGQREHAADLHTPFRRLIDTLVGVAEDDGAVGEPVIDVLVAVDIPDPGALAVIDIDRLVISPVSEIGRNAERQPVNCPLEVLVGLRK